jgi:hypothetical protein
MDTLKLELIFKKSGKMSKQRLRPLILTNLNAFKEAMGIEHYKKSQNWPENTIESLFKIWHVKRDDEKRAHLSKS